MEVFPLGASSYRNILCYWLVYDAGGGGNISDDDHLHARLMMMMMMKNTIVWPLRLSERVRARVSA